MCPSGWQEWHENWRWNVMAALLKSFSPSAPARSPWSLEVDAGGLLQPVQVDDGERVVQGIADVCLPPVATQHHPARRVPSGDVPKDELRRHAQVVGEDPRLLLGCRSAHDPEQPFDIHDGDTVGGAAGHEGELAVECEYDVGGIREMQVGLVQKHLVDPAVGPGYAQAVGDGPALLDARHRTRFFVRFSVKKANRPLGCQLMPCRRLAPAPLACPRRLPAPRRSA